MDALLDETTLSKLFFRPSKKELILKRKSLLPCESKFFPFRDGSFKKKKKKKKKSISHEMPFFNSNMFFTLTFYVVHVYCMTGNV